MIENLSVNLKEFMRCEIKKFKDSKSIVYSFESLCFDLIDQAINIDDSFNNTVELLNEVARYLWDKWHKPVSNIKPPSSNIGTKFDISEAKKQLKYCINKDDCSSKDNAYIEYLIGALCKSIFDYELAYKYFYSATRHDTKTKYLKMAGETAMKLSKFIDAEKFFRLEVKLLSEFEQDDNYAEALNNLGGSLYQQYQYKEAEQIFEESLRMLSNRTDSELFGIVLNNMGGLFKTLHCLREAETYFTIALDIRRETSTAHGLATTKNNLADVFRKMGRIEKSEEILNETLTELKRFYSKSCPNHPRIATTLNNLGALHYAEYMNEKKARDLFKEALSILSFYFEDSYPDVSITLHNLALASLECCEYKEASEYFRRALHGINKRLANDPLSIEIQKSYVNNKDKLIDGLFFA